MKIIFYRVYKILGWTSITLALLLVILRFALPLITPQVPRLPEWVATQLRYPTLIQDIKLHWDGLTPEVSLYNVEILTQDKKSSALHIQSMKLRLNFFQLLLKRLSLDELEIEQAVGGLIYYPQSKTLAVAKLEQLQFNLQDQQTTDFPLCKRLIIKNSQISVDIDKKGKIELEAVNLLGEVSSHLKMQAQAKVAGKTPALVHFNADIPLFGQKSKQLYFHWQGGDLNTLTALLYPEVTLKHDFADLKIWGDIKDNNAIELISEIDLEKFEIYHHDIPEISIQKMQGPISIKLANQDWELDASKLILQSAKSLTHNLMISTTLEHAQVTFKDNIGNVSVLSQAISADAKDIYSKEVLFNDLALILKWHTSEAGLVVDTGLNTKMLSIPLQANATFTFSKQRLPEADIFLHIDESTTHEAIALLPDNKLDVDLIHWLQSAFVKGEHKGTTFVLRGNLQEFPFDDAQGVFEVNSELENVTLNYKDRWPALTNLNATMLMHNRALFISGQKGNILQGQITDADAVIPDLFAKMPELVVDTKISSTLKEGLEVITNSPLPATLVKTVAPLSFDGPMTLSLGLEIPLSSKSAVPVKVRGLVEVSDATVALKENPHAITALKGEVSFTQESIKADDLTGILLSMPCRFTMASNLNGDQSEILISAMGNVDVENVQSLLNIPKFSQLTGQTDFIAQLSLSPQANSQAVLTLSSSLKGLSIEAPLPFAKTKEAHSPLELKMYLEPHQLIRIAGKYGDTVTMAYSLGLHDKQWQGVGGHIHFGENRVAKFREDQVLLVDGNLAEVDFLQWKLFLAGIGLITSANTTNVSAHFPLEPLVELDIGSFNLYGATFENEKIEARWDTVSNQWNLLFDGAALKGQIVIPKNEAKAATVDLQKLALANTLAESNFTMSKIPSLQSIDIKIKEFVLGNKTLTNIQARIEPSWKGYFFPTVSASMKDTEISLSGSWDYLSLQSKISAEGKVNTKNISQTLSSFGLKGTLQKAKGSIDFSLNWFGSPFKLDYNSLTGVADFSLNGGSIQGMNPGIGRVLSLLNLDNVKRRLNLDFSDVTKNGFAFDEFSGKFQFGKGKVSTNKVILNGPSAKIEAFGQADLENQGLDGEMIVMPNVTGSLPVAAAIAAGNPAVGAAVWVVDKMFGHKIQQIHRVRYKVLGTWAMPKVNEVPMPLRG
ncbi:MAG: hypothetical protein JSR17_02975 [Proteobacteria bacterium]|nr:hypothetical protein [Pseudomonadota bacterium]